VPGEEVLLGHFLTLFLLFAQAGRIVLGDEGADFVAEGDVLGREVEIHGGLPVSASFEEGRFVVSGATIDVERAFGKMTLASTEANMIRVQLRPHRSAKNP
jgi:hypothetical protein